jgi:hypothetical protein
MGFSQGQAVINIEIGMAKVDIDFCEDDLPTEMLGASDGVMLSE